MLSSVWMFRVHIQHMGSEGQSVNQGRHHGCVLKHGDPIRELEIGWYNDTLLFRPVSDIIVGGYKGTLLLCHSYARGTYTPDSDVDLAIFSSHFEQMERIEGFRFLFLQAMDYGIDLQPQPFSLQDFREPLGIVEEIIENGIEVWLKHCCQAPNI